MTNERAVQAKFAEIVAELQTLGWWEIEAPAPEAYENMGAFGINTMAFAQWLRFVFAPRIESLLESGGPWPATSQVGAHAVRELDGQHDASRLVTLLCEFDRLF